MNTNTSGNLEKLRQDIERDMQDMRNRDQKINALKNEIERLSRDMKHKEEELKREEMEFMNIKREHEKRERDIAELQRQLQASTKSASQVKGGSIRGSF